MIAPRYQTVILLCLVWLVGPPTVDARDSLHADIVVADDASVTVKETIHIESGDAWFKNEFDRNLPTAARRLFGLEHPNGFQLLECLKDGKPETYKVIGDKGVTIQIGDFMDTAPIPPDRTYTLKYKLEDQIVSSKEVDSLSWTVTEKYWGWWPIDVSATVSPPGDSSAHLKTSQMFMESEGKTETIPSAARVSQGVVYFSAPRPLGQTEGLTISLSCRQDI